MAVATIVLVLLALGSVFLAMRSSSAPEFWWLVHTADLIVLTFVFQRARVLTVPLMFVWIIIGLFWSARRSAEREDEG